MHSTGTRAIGALGSLDGGILIATIGVPDTLLTGSVVFLISAVAVTAMSAPERRAHHQPDTDSGVIRNAVAGLILLWRLPVVRILLITAFVVEMFAFAYGSVMPSLARDVLAVGADGLGTLNLMSGLGAVAGVALLGAFGHLVRSGRLLILTTILFGTALMTFSSSGVFLWSLLLVTAVGAMAAGFDALQWTLLQQ